MLHANMMRRTVLCNELDGRPMGPGTSPTHPPRALGGFCGAAPGTPLGVTPGSRAMSISVHT